MRKVRAGEIFSVRAALGAITGIALPTIIVFLSAAPEIFSVLAPKNYETALPVLFISAIIPLPLALASCLCSIAVAKEKTLGILLSGIVCAMAAIILDFTLIEHGALYVPALITAGCYVALMLLESSSVRKTLGESAINVNKTFQHILFLAFFSALLFTLRSFLILRILIAFTSALYLLYMLHRSKWLLSEQKHQ